MTLKEYIDDYFEKATKKDVEELLARARARARLSEDAIAMWEGPDEDFFPLPEESE